METLDREKDEAREESPSDAEVSSIKEGTIIELSQREFIDVKLKK